MIVECVDQFLAIGGSWATVNVPGRDDPRNAQ